MNSQNLQDEQPEEIEPLEEDGVRIEKPAEISQTVVWRVLVLLSPGEKLGLVADFGWELARSHGGELLIGCVIPAGVPYGLKQGRQTLIEASRLAAEDGIAVTHLVLIEVENDRTEKALEKLVNHANIDLLLSRADRPVARRLSRLPCDVGVVRGNWELLDRAPAEQKIERILVPTAGGPNTGAAFDLLLPLSDKMEVTALYVAADYLGGRERIHGFTVLRETLQLADAQESVRRKVIMAPNAVSGIVETAGENYDLVIMGANEDTLDRVMFGDVVAAVVRDSGKPVLIMRRHQRVGSTFLARIDWRLRRLMPHLNREARRETYSRIRQNSRPEISFFVLISLSAAIASFGLLQNSPAVVIGAMLVAPLMSPIVGVGMAMVLGEVRFLQMALRAVGRGVGLALLVGGIIGLVQIGRPLPEEVLARTAPNLLDLGVALFSGFAGAYALCYSQAAGALPGVAIAAALVPPLAAVGITAVTGHYDKTLGALLLFGTNFITIASAAAFAFFVLGFRPASSEKEERLIQLRTVRIAIALLVVNAAILGVATYRLVSNVAFETRVVEAVESGLAQVTAGQAVLDGPPDVGRREGERQIVDIDLSVRSPRILLPPEAAALQEAIAAQLRAEGVSFDEVALNLSVIQVTRVGPAETESIDN